MFLNPTILFLGPEQHLSLPPKMTSGIDFSTLLNSVADPDRIRDLVLF
jgi:hypothetical protein